jgi:hypothetical protein
MTATAQVVSAAAKTLGLKGMTLTAVSTGAALTVTAAIATPISGTAPLSVSVVSLPPMSSGPGAIPIAALVISLLSAGFTYLPWHRRRRNLEQKLTVFKRNLGLSVKSAEDCIAGLGTTVRMQKARVNFVTTKGLYDAFEITSEDLSELAALGEFEFDGAEVSLIYLKIRLVRWFELMKTQSMDGAYRLTFDSWPEYEEWRDRLNELQDLKFTVQMVDLALERLRAPFYRYWFGCFEEAAIAEHLSQGQPGQKPQ